MKRLILLVILICNLSASHKINNEFTDIEKEYILTNTLKIGMIIDYYPFSFEENGKAKGFSFDHGKIDAAFNNIISGQKYIKKMAYSNIEIIEDLDPSIIRNEDLRIGVNK